MKHAASNEIARRITVNRAELDATHTAMMAMLTGQNDFAALTDEWAGMAQRYDALAAQSDELHAELDRRAREHTHA